MFSMDMWLTFVCGSIAWGAIWSAGKLALQAAKNTGRKRG